MRQLPVKQASRTDHANRVRKRLGDQILNIVFPPRCAGCSLWNETIFCLSCTTQLKNITFPICYCCGAPFDISAQVLPDSLCADCRDNRYHHAPLLDLRRAPFRYSGPIREAIHSFKYRGKTSLAASLASLLAEYSGHRDSGLLLNEFDTIVPVPLHSVRRWRRGYNQSTLLAQELGSIAGISFVELLKRTRHTVPQVELEADERAQNVKNAFAMDERAWREYSRVENVLLLDDVATTGATLEECARVLKKRGVKNVGALTLAR